MPRFHCLLPKILTEVGRRWLVALTVLFLLILLFFALPFGQGGLGFFSPDTLECRTQAECMLPLIQIPIYRSSFTYYRHELVEYLIARGYWKPNETSQPRWIEMFHWNHQWRGGTGGLHKELGWRGREWIDWTTENPELAEVIWPMVLEAMRSEPDGGGAAYQILFAAKYSKSMEEFKERLKE